MTDDEGTQENVVDAYKTVYDKVLAPVPRNSYLVSGDISLRNNTFARGHRIFLLKRFAVLLSLILISGSSLTGLILLAVVGHTLSIPFAVLFVLGALFAIADIRSVAKYKKYRLQKYAYLQMKATDYEPSGIWRFNDFPTLGRRLVLIHALLGARRMERMLAESTTTAIDSESSDALISHLIISLAKCPEDDIDPYLEIKAEQFCEAVFVTTKRLLPIMELHTMLLNEGIKKRKEAGASDE